MAYHCHLSLFITIKPVLSSQTTIRSTQTKAVEKIDTAAEHRGKNYIIGKSAHVCLLGERNSMK